jgi:glycosyltransferase involved in cell wall biosynthesis
LINNAGSKRSGVTSWIDLVISNFHSQQWIIDVAVSIDFPDDEELRLKRLGCNVYKCIERESKQILWLSILFDYFKIVSLTKLFSPDLIINANIDPGRQIGYLLTRVPIAFFFHTIPDTGFRYGYKYFIYLASLKANVRLAHVSNNSRESFNNYLGMKLHNSIVIHNSVNCMCPNSNSSKRFLERKVILTVASLHEYRNPILWLECAKKITSKFKDVDFIWVGEGPYLKILRDQVLKLELSNRIIFPGQKESVKEYYAMANIYFQPSLIENHSISILEAMSCGLPCVVSSAGGMLESVTHLKTGYISQSGDVEEYIVLLSKLIESRSLRSKMAKNSVLQYENIFSFKGWCQKMDGMKKSLLSR